MISPNDNWRENDLSSIVISIVTICYVKYEICESRCVYSHPHGNSHW